MGFNLTPVQNAVARLAEGLARFERDTDDEQVGDGLIHRFEIAYDLCHRALRRFLRENAASPDEFDEMNLADLIRSGNKAGLLRAEWAAWRRYRDMRARCIDGCDSVAALAVAGEIPEFLIEAQFLADELMRRA